MSKKISIAILCIFIANIVSIVCNGIDFFNGIILLVAAVLPEKLCGAVFVGTEVFEPIADNCNRVFIL